MDASIRCLAVVAFLLFVAPLANAADSPAPSHSCRKPGKAADIKTQQEADKFNEAVDRYKALIEDFVRQQEEAAAIHRGAASQAISEWNEFVTKDMKR